MSVAQNNSISTYMDRTEQNRAEQKNMIKNERLTICVAYAPDVLEVSISQRVIGKRATGRGTFLGSVAPN